MPRFSIDLDDEVEGPANGGELVYSSDEDDEEDEPAHPLGFASCRFGLLDRSFSSDRDDEWVIRKPNESLRRLEDAEELIMTELTPVKQQYPPIESYIDTSVIPRNALIQYATKLPRPDDRNEIETISQLLAAASLSKPLALPSITPIETITQPYEQMQADARRIEQEMEQERRRLAREHQSAVDGLKTLLRQQKEAADKIVAEQARIDAEAEQALKDEERKLEEDRQKEEAVRVKQQKEDDQKREQQRAEQEAMDAQAQAAKAAAAKEFEFLHRADTLIAQLKEVRESASTFEASKAVSVKKRRLEMKKLVGGKVNTLAENADKIRSVASDVSQAITAARDEDEVVKQQLAAGDTSYSREMARGKRYLVDLLCSKVMVRVQSEGFNGQRGDGFPLANMLAQVSKDHKDMALVLEAHIYTECPTAIPRLPVIDPDASEEELMTALGMKQNSDGTSETFKRFLDRTESIISIVADIMSSKPEDHTLFGGNAGAVKWLKRFLRTLPDAPTAPLPLLTAPVLDAFLTGAGHMLANLHEEAFKPLLETITSDIVNRLDEGPIGAPSATRLRKTIGGGLDGFKRKLPSKALAELYNAGTGRATSASFGASQQSTAFQSHQTQSVSNPFASSSSAPSSGKSPFGATSAAFGTSAPAPSPFSQSNVANQGGSTVNQSPFGGASATASPFGNPLPSANQAPAPAFGTSTNQTTTSTPFGSSLSSFGNTSNQIDNSLQYSSSGSAFGTQSGAMGGFGSPNAAAPSPFGASNTNQGQQQSGFISGSTASSPFGTSASSSTTFGASGGGIATPFGGSSPSPFGGSSSSATPFGGGLSSSTPFGGGSASTTGFGSGSLNPFGGASASTGFGGGSASSPFGGVGASSPFGGGQGTGTQSFGSPAPAPTPFGGGSSSSTPFGGSSSLSTPFGGGLTTGFGQQQQQSSGFGQQQQQQQQGGGFGRGGKSKPPCKFFASGSCRFGDNCRFSHETGGGGGGFGASTAGGFGNQGGGGGFGSSSYATPFGGPRR